MKNLYKYLFFLVLGIILYILLNGKDGFSVGIPEYKFELIKGKIVGKEISDTHIWTEEKYHIYDMDLEYEEIYYVWAKDITEAESKLRHKLESTTGGGATPAPLPLSIQIHEFALFVHYQLRGKDPDFTFYVQPFPQMRLALVEVYGKILENDEEYDLDDLRNIRKISGGELPVEKDNGLKIPFEEIFKRYKGIVPELYQFKIVDNSYKNKYGFQLLDKRENRDKILAFYTVVKEYFCKILSHKDQDYMNDLKTKYPGQDWKEYGTMTYGNFNKSDVLNFLKDKINEVEDTTALKELVQYYVNIFSMEMGDVRKCSDGVGWQHSTNEGTYMIVKLKDPKSEFVYDNTEMVVHTCNFESGIPAQYHIGIMRNPSDLMDRKFRKLFSSDKYDAIIGLNAESRMF